MQPIILGTILDEPVLGDLCAGLIEKPDVYIIDGKTVIVTNNLTDHQEMLDRTKTSRRRKNDAAMTPDFKEEILGQICEKIAQYVNLGLIKKTEDEVSVLVLLLFEEQTMLNIHLCYYCANFF